MRIGDAQRGSHRDHLADVLGTVLGDQTAEDAAERPADDVDRTALEVDEPVDLAEQRGQCDVVGADVGSEAPTVWTMAEQLECPAQRNRRHVTADEPGQHQHMAAVPTGRRGEEPGNKGQIGPELAEGGDLSSEHSGASHRGLVGRVQGRDSGEAEPYWSATSGVTVRGTHRHQTVICERRPGRAAARR